MKCEPCHQSFKSWTTFIRHATRLHGANAAKLRRAAVQHDDADFVLVVTQSGHPLLMVTDGLFPPEALKIAPGRT